MSETLQGHESAETDSNARQRQLAAAFLRRQKHPQLSESPTVRPLDVQGRLADLAPTPTQAEICRSVGPEARLPSAVLGAAAADARFPRP